VNAFADGLDLTLVEDGAGRPRLRDGRCVWALSTPLIYAAGPAGAAVIVPAGYVTDLASIPRFAWSLGFAPDGPWAKAAVVHDYLYATRGLSGRYSRAQADGILDQAMAALGVPAWRRAVIWAAVRLGGAGGWGR
jgi:hypothetical protein